MKRFLLFAFPRYYPAGGEGDVLGDFDTMEDVMDARAKAEPDLYGAGFSLLDMEKREWVKIPDDRMSFTEGPPVDLSGPEDHAQ